MVAISVQSMTVVTLTIFGLASALPSAQTQTTGAPAQNISLSDLQAATIVIPTVVDPAKAPLTISVDPSTLNAAAPVLQQIIDKSNLTVASPVDTGLSRRNLVKRKPVNCSPAGISPGVQGFVWQFFVAPICNQWFAPSAMVPICSTQTADVNGLQGVKLHYTYTIGCPITNPPGTPLMFPMTPAVCIAELTTIINDCSFVPVLQGTNNNGYGEFNSWSISAT